MDPHALALLAPAFKAALTGAVEGMPVDYPDGGSIPESTDAFCLTWLGRGGATEQRGRHVRDALVDWRQNVHVAFVVPVTPGIDHATFQANITTVFLMALAGSADLPKIAISWSPVEMDFAFGDEGGNPEMGGILTYEVHLKFDNNTGKARFV